MSRNWDRPLVMSLVALMGFGLVQVYSSSYIFASEVYGSGLYFFLKQLISVGIGIAILVTTAKIPWSLWERSFPFFWILTTVMILSTFVPGLGIKVGGAKRWLNFGVSRFEPSELLKIFTPWLVCFLYKNWKISNHWSRKPYSWFVWILPFLLLLKQPDFGSFVLLNIIMVLMLFMVGFRWKHLVYVMILMVPSFTFLVVKYPYRLKRVVAFLNPWADPSNSGFQLIQSLLSVRNGGFWGKGLGAGQGKLFFLPEAHTDFTLAVFAEETGFIGVSLLFLLYGFIFFRAFQIALYLKSVHHRLLVLGISFLFGLNTLFNVAVVLGLLPTKGLTLPFLSYGGSSLICYCVAFGWILNLDANSASLEAPKVNFATATK